MGFVMLFEFLVSVVLCSMKFRREVVSVSSVRVIVCLCICLVREFVVLVNVS